MQVAQSKSKNGGDFLQFLDDLPSWEKKPKCVSHLLKSATTLIVERLSVLVDPPYKADDLTSNVACAADAIKEEAINLIINKLE